MQSVIVAVEWENSKGIVKYKLTSKASLICMYHQRIIIPFIPCIPFHLIGPHVMPVIHAYKNNNFGSQLLYYFVFRNNIRQENPIQSEVEPFVPRGPSWPFLKTINSATSPPSREAF